MVDSIESPAAYTACADVTGPQPVSIQVRSPKKPRNMHSPRSGSSSPKDRETMDKNLSILKPMLENHTFFSWLNSVRGHLVYPRVGAEIMFNALMMMKNNHDLIKKFGLRMEHILFEYIQIRGENWWSSIISEDLDKGLVERNIRILNQDFDFEIEYEKNPLAEQLANWIYTLSTMKFIIDKRWNYTRYSAKS